MRFTTLGSWTLEDKEAKKGAEPDECYVFGADSKSAKRPHLAIEIVWTSEDLNKLEVYRVIGVEEVWYWRAGRLGIHRLEEDGYVEATRSVVLPGIDLDELTSFLDRPTTSDSITGYRDLLRRQSASAK